MDNMKLPDLEKRNYFRKFDLFEKKAYRSTESFYKKKDQEQVLANSNPFYLKEKQSLFNRNYTNIKGKHINRPVSCTPYWPTTVVRKVDTLIVRLGFLMLGYWYSDEYPQQTFRK